MFLPKSSGWFCFHEAYRLVYIYSKNISTFSKDFLKLCKHFHKLTYFFIIFPKFPSIILNFNEFRLY